MTMGTGDDGGDSNDDDESRDGKGEDCDNEKVAGASICWASMMRWAWF